MALENSSSNKPKTAKKTSKKPPATISTPTKRATTARPPRKAAAKKETPATAKSESAKPPKPSTARKKPKGGYEYDVAFSFAGEDRRLVENVNAQLRRSHIKTFYDFDHQIKLVGENLFDLLSDIYENKARFCAMFISKHYVEKQWTNLERQAAQARAFADEDVYILPIRLDSTPVPGVLRTTGHVAMEGKTARDIARIIRLKVQDAHERDEGQKGLKRTSKSSPAASSPAKGAASTITAKASPAPLVPAPSAFAHQGKVSASGTWLMLNDEFYRAPSVQSEGGSLLIEIKPRNADEEAQLEALDPNRHPYQGHQEVSYAHGNKAFRASVERVDTRSQSGKATCVVKLKPSSNYPGTTGLGSWADEAAEKQARLILLGEHVATSSGYNNMYASYGAGHSIPKEGVFPALWKRLRLHKRRMQSVDVLRCARLEALYKLKSSGTVEHVSHLALGPANKGVLSVDFEGHPAERHSGQIRATIRFSGKCNLVR